MTWDEESSLILRVVALQRANALPLVLADCGRYYLCGSDVRPWETRRSISVERLRELVEAAEAGRKPAVREERVWDGWLARRG